MTLSHSSWFAAVASSTAGFKHSAPLVALVPCPTWLFQWYQHAASMLVSALSSWTRQALRWCQRCPAGQGRPCLGTGCRLAGAGLPFAECHFYGIRVPHIARCNVWLLQTVRLHCSLLLMVSDTVSQVHDGAIVDNKVAYMHRAARAGPAAPPHQPVKIGF